MCGINGIVSRFQKEDLKYRTEKMNDSLQHRGPDAGGVHVLKQGRVVLGHRRLSIIDLNNRSTQPMVSNSTRWIISYNGEIYNFKELKEKVNYSFNTESDTEVILAYLECYGIDDLLSVCNGMFAFAAYDTVKEELYLCRDRLGIKPLYYYLDNDLLIFSSEIKGILCSGLVEAIMDEESIDDYLGYRYVREPYTFFKNIFQVESGTYLRVSSDLKMQEKRYWDIPIEFNCEKEYDENAILKEFQQRLEKAVKIRTISDVPVGTYLSGGIDSSLLTAMVANESSKRVNTYTIGFDKLNEFAFSQMVADKYDTLHHKIEMSENEYMDRIAEIISYKDAPLGVPNEIPLAIMSKALKKEITVVLSGEGADELLGGYGRIFRAPFDFQNKHQGDFYQYFVNQYEYVPREIRDKVLKVTAGRRKSFDKKIAHLFRENINEYNVFYFFHKYHVKGLLQRVDSTTMFASVEARVPFLDHTLVEYVYKSVPYDLKLRWKNEKAKKSATEMNAAEYSESLDIPKYLLKKLSYSYLPAEVIERKKMGFPVPLEKWDGSIHSALKEKMKAASWLNEGMVDYLLNECKKYKNGNQLLWMFLNIQIFEELYFRKEWRY